MLDEQGCLPDWLLCHLAINRVESPVGCPLALSAALETPVSYFQENWYQPEKCLDYSVNSVLKVIPWPSPIMSWWRQNTTTLLQILSLPNQLVVLTVWGCAQTRANLTATDWPRTCFKRVPTSTFLKTPCPCHKKPLIGRVPVLIGHQPATWYTYHTHALSHSSLNSHWPNEINNHHNAVHSTNTEIHVGHDQCIPWAQKITWIVVSYCYDRWDLIT